MHTLNRQIAKKTSIKSPTPIPKRLQSPDSNLNDTLQILNQAKSAVLNLKNQ